MFSNLLEWIRKQVSRILPSKSIEEKMDIEFDISDEMIDSIEKWSKMYEGNADWIDGDKVKSLNIASSVASEMARLVTIEMESEITSGKKEENDRSTYLNNQYQKVVDSLRVQTEYAAAKGGMIFKPYIDGDNIAIDYVQADNFYPVEFSASGELIAVIFPEVIKRDKAVYTRLEYHHMLADDKCYISNTAYVKRDGVEGLGMKTALSSVKEWEHLEPEVNLKNIKEPLFSYFKMPLANNRDTTSRLGVSVYSKAVNLIEEVDKHYSSILWEYASKESAIDVSEDLLYNKELPEGKDRLFRRLDTDDDGFYKVFSPQIRDESLYNGLNKLLQRVEFNCGLAYGTLSDVQEMTKTATEVTASKQRSYATIVDIQKSLRISLEHLIVSMDYLATFYGLVGKGDYVVSFDFDDSIIIDSNAEQAIMLNEVAAGLIKPEFYLMKRYGLEEEAAREMLPDYDTGIDESQYDDLE